jgi:hypothetical protein
MSSERHGWTAVALGVAGGFPLSRVRRGALLR